MDVLSSLLTEKQVDGIKDIILIILGVLLSLLVVLAFVLTGKLFYYHL